MSSFRSARPQPAATPSARRRRAGLVLGLLLLGLAVVTRSILADLPDPARLVERVSPDSSKIYDRRGRLLFELLDPRAGRRTRVPLEALPPALPAAVIAVEDARFYDNPGIEPRGIARALWQLARERRVVSGGSTITQQLARQVLMEPEERLERSPRRKLREILLALRINRRFSKDQVLEMYLNEVYFGQLAYGVEAAARSYFDKPARDLDLAESALLAGLIQSPATYNPLVDLDAARARQALVLDRMVESGSIGPAEAEEAKALPLHLGSGGPSMAAPHFVSWVISRLELRYGAERLHGGGLQVLSSLDLDLQRAAEDVVARRVAELARPAPGKPEHEAGNAALVAIDPGSGEVLAMVGSADPDDPAIDGAVNVALALRQPGSAIKPLTYAAAFDPARWGLRGPAQPGAPARLPFTPATVLGDLPTSFTTREGEPYRPLNYDRRWHGPISLRRALATSSNLVAVKVLDAVGIAALIDTAEDLGIESLRERGRYGLALTLGGGEVRLLELTAAYAGLAAGGRRVEPRPILAVLDPAELAELLERDPELASLRVAPPAPAEPAIDPRVAWLVTDLLSDDRARLPAFGEGSVLELGRPAAVKTGTTTDFRDNWTLGYTPQLATGVWLGNADGRPMRWISGVQGAGPIWQDFMTRAHLGRPVLGFDRPEGLVQREICEAGGFLAGPDCRRRRKEWFIAGTEPEQVDPSYQALWVEPGSGRVWVEGCGGAPLRRVFRLLPPEARDWGRQAGIEPPPERDCLGRPVRLTLGDGTATEVGSPSGATASEGRRPPLELTSPAAGSRFALSTRLPQGAQRIELRARLQTEAELLRVELAIDGRTIGRPERPPYRASWALEPGRHVARALAWTRDGRRLSSPEVGFEVVTEQEIDDIDG